MFASLLHRVAISSGLTATAWLLVALLCLYCIGAKAATTHYDDFEQLALAARTAQPGDVLVLRDGQYDLDEAVTLAVGEGGSVDSPVVVQAETVGGCILRGDTTAFAFKPGASHVVVSGFQFQLQDETAVKIEGSNHIRVTRCTFQLDETDSFDWLVITGANSHHNRVDHCLFADKSQPGNYVTIDGDSNGQQSQHDRIDHNLFRDIGPRAKNEKEAIRVGWSEISLSSGFTVLEDNYFERCDGDPEIVSIKSCDNIFRHNAIVDSMGVVSLRHGNRSTIHGNVILGKGREGCGGIRVYGDDHRIYNNYLANLTGERYEAALAITNGDAENARPGSNLSAHFRPRRLQVVNNSLINNAHTIELGYNHPGKKPWRYAPSEILFANNLLVSDRGALIEIYTKPEDCQWENNVFWPVASGQLSNASADGIASQVADPQLLASQGLLMPAKSGPASNRGRAFDYIQHDLAGTKRESKPDVGALEIADREGPSRLTAIRNAAGPDASP